LTWNSISGVEYGVETTVDLAIDNWTLIAGSRQAAPGEASSYTHTNGALDGIRFYRVVTYAGTAGAR
jgi:hypothetical protein